MRTLLIGCGHRRIKVLHRAGMAEWGDLTTLDINPDCRPDVEWNLERIPLPFSDESFDEIHCYEALEHVGTQGDYRFFFAQFSDFWRILKPDGALCATVPDVSSRWALGDPSHTRIITPEQLTFLVQPNYDKHVGTTAMSDFRRIYRADFEPEFAERLAGGDSFGFVLRAVKPSRVST